MTAIEQLQQLIDDHNNIVFFGGAGVSTESGIPDFRSVDGLYSQSYDYPPESIVSHTFFVRKNDIFWKFYREKMLVTDVEPNPAHKKLAQLEAAGKVKAVITQNIDGLHQKAGSKVVYELHGSVLRNYCQKCGRFYSGQELLSLDTVPRCDCGGYIKPDVVLYEEGLDTAVVNGAIRAIEQADLLIIGGTSLVVYPAAGLIDYFHGDSIVMINKGATGRDGDVDLLIREPIGEVLDRIQVR